MGTLRVGSLCTGIGGLDMAVEQATGAETVWCSDIDKGAGAVLAARWPDVPNIGDFTTVDSFAPVDILTGGFPCQPVSGAGKRLAMDDERWLFDAILAAIGRMDPRPQLCVFENVVGLLSAAGGDAMARVVEGLAAVGYVGSYGVLGSSAVGGCHRRLRVWIVAADATSQRGSDLSWSVAAGERPVAGAGGRGGGGGATSGAGLLGPGALLPTPRTTDSHGPGVHGDGGLDLRTAVALLPTPVVNDMGAGKTVDEWDEWTATMRDRHGNGNGHGPSLSIEAARLLDEPLLPGQVLPEHFGGYTAAVDRWASVFGRPAPTPTIPSKGKPVLSPRFVEWMLGYPDKWVDVGIPRTAQLKCLGNAVQPQTAAAALPALLARLDGR